jgi:hypothetical protein
MKWGLRTRIIYWLTKRRRGRIHLATRVRAYNPKLLELAFRMDIHTAARGTVPAILKQFAQIKVAVLVGLPSLNRYPFCRGQTTRHYRGSTASPSAF